MRYRARGARRRWWGCCLLLSVACGGSEPSTTPAVAEITLSPDPALLVGVGDTLTLSAVARDSSGRVLRGVELAWRSSDPTVLSVDGSGRVTSMGEGSASVFATSGSAGGSARVEVYLPAEVGEYEPGVSYLGRNGYVEYVPGTLPVVISAPHGGDLEPGEIADRTYGTTVQDTNTRETLQAVRDALVERTGHAPHVVISHLRRTKLDPNRDVAEAAQGNPFAEQAWEEFQGFIERARTTVEEGFGSGLYLDLHGHGHEIQRAELGYLLAPEDFDQPDTVLDLPVYAERSSVRALFHESDDRFSQVLRGPRSLGGLLEAEGLRSVPSPGDPTPGGEPYFTGGYNTVRHGSREEGVGVSAIQIELPRAGVRDTDEERARFGARLAAAVEAFMNHHYGFFRPS